MYRAKDATVRNGIYRSLAIRQIPFFRCSAPKLISRPRRKSLSLSCVKSCFQVNREHCFNRFQLYDDTLFNDEIGTVPLFKFDSIVNDWDRHLPCNMEVLFPEFVG
jgi:hypothetical protein